MRDYSEIKSMIGTLHRVADKMKTIRMEQTVWQDVQAACQEINRQLYHHPVLKCQNIYQEEDENDLAGGVANLEQLLQIWENTLTSREAHPMDTEFWDIYEFFKYVDVESIYQKVLNYFQRLPEGLRIEFLSLPQRYTFLTGKLDFVREDYSLIRIYVEMMSREVEKYRWLYEHLADYRSKRTLNGIVKYWFSFDIAELHQYTENVFSDYYDLDILQCGSEDVVVDLGAYTGDSIHDYIHNYGMCKKVYAYEITPGTYQTLLDNLSGYPNIDARQKGVGRQHGTMYVNDLKDNAGNKILEKGEIAVEVVSIDDDIKEKITVVKMDIEGSEKDAILGMQQHIQREKPALLISAYHAPDDIFRIPYIINRMRDDYKFYLRFNGSGIWPCDYNLIAV